MEHENDNFYRGEFFKQWNDRLTILEAKIEDIHADVNDVKNRIAYIYGVAAGAGVLSSIIINWIKNKFF